MDYPIDPKRADCELICYHQKTGREYNYIKDVAAAVAVQNGEYTLTWLGQGWTFDVRKGVLLSCSVEVTPEVALRLRELGVTVPENITGESSEFLDLLDSHLEALDHGVNTIPATVAGFKEEYKLLVDLGKSREHLSKMNS